MAASSSRYSPSSSSSFKYRFNYDVFLSFRGEDTRHGFSGSLYKALCDRGIHTFFDKDALLGGEEIRSTLVKAIEESRIAIPVISINYASSSFCLEELHTIMKNKDMLVLPIFYKVDPSDVRHQRGAYNEALAKHENKFKNNKEKVLNWRKALNQVAELSGHHFKDGNEYEYEFIEKIVKVISRKIDHTLEHVAAYPVGLDSQLLEVKKLVDVPSIEGTHMVGIIGHGGLGKTTLALAIYNLIADHFDGLCFLRDIRESSKRHGLHYIQEILLSKLLGEKEFKLASVNEGISRMKHRLRLKKVLLILDDVDDIKQLEALAGDPDWFGRGSRVLITTRNRQLLALHNVERIYKVKELSNEDSLQLLKWNAFRNEEIIDPCFTEVLNRVVNYCSGLPLALEVIGSSLYQKSLKTWESAISQYETIPNDQILQKLKLSYDALGDEEKSAFLDIACCFSGHVLTEVQYILYARHGYPMEHSIEILIDRCLIKIFCGEVTLHDLIKDMARDIVQRESRKVPGNRSRLWFHGDIANVLRHNKGTDRIEIIFLQFPFDGRDTEVKWSEDPFEKMENLEILIIKNGHFPQGPTHLPNSLKVLEWNGYPLNKLPSEFCPEKLVICKLPDSKFSTDGLIHSTSIMGFNCVKVLRFHRCPYLTHIPNVSSLSNLEHLSFRGCKNLLTIDESVGLLNNLKSLGASECSNLRSLPPFMLPSLEELGLLSCTKLESFPEILGKMENIKAISWSNNRIKTLPPSFKNLTRLRELIAFYHESQGDSVGDGASFFNRNILTMMPELSSITVKHMHWQILPKEDEGGQRVICSNIRYVNLENCKLTDESLLLLPSWFPNLKELFIERENFKVIPKSFEELGILELLYLKQCQYLEDIQGVPPKLKSLVAVESTSMTHLSRNKLLNKELHKAGDTSFQLPGDVIPEWFEHRSNGTSISFWFRKELPPLVLCFALTYSGLKSDLKNRLCLKLSINGSQYVLPSVEDMPLHSTYLLGLSNLRFWYPNLDMGLPITEWNHAEVTCLADIPQQVPVHINIRSGFHVVNQESRMQDIRFTDPFAERDKNVPETQTMQQQRQEMGGFHVLEQESSMQVIQISDPFLGTQSDDAPDHSESQNHPSVRNYRSVDMDVSKTQIVQQQHCTCVFSRAWNWAGSVLSLCCSRL